MYNEMIILFIKKREKYPYVIWMRNEWVKLFNCIPKSII